MTPPGRLFSLARAQNRPAGFRAERITQRYKTHSYKEGEEKGTTKKQVMLAGDEREKYSEQATDNKASGFSTDMKTSVRCV